MNSNEYMNDNCGTPVIPLPNPGEGGPVYTGNKSNGVNPKIRSPDHPQAAPV